MRLLIARAERICAVANVLCAAIPEIAEIKTASTALGVLRPVTLRVLISLVGSEGSG
jgi:hypothetical protein